MSGRHVLARYLSTTVQVSFSKSVSWWQAHAWKPGAAWAWTSGSREARKRLCARAVPGSLWSTMSGAGGGGASLAPCTSSNLERLLHNGIPSAA